MQITRSHATAWADDNIQVNCFLPGWIDTRLTKLAKRKIPTLNQNVLKRTPAGRWGTPNDLAGIAIFLSSSASDFITGTAIPVDGGYSIALQHHNIIKTNYALTQKPATIILKEVLSTTIKFDN